MTTADAPRVPGEAALHQVEARLRERVRGEVRFDDRARTLYASDASPYEEMPYGVVLPRDAADVRATVEVARDHGVPVLMRGGGTSLAGQTVGAAVVVDVSKYMTRILAVDPKARTARVEPGVVRDTLNAHLAEHELQFTPDVSTTDRANVGGMVANNSAGTRSIKYGKTVDAVESMRVLLADGTETELRALTPEELDVRIAQGDRVGRLHGDIRDLVREHEAEIEARFPKVMRRVGGYNLDELVGGRPFNLAKLVAGSEGTLAAILEVTLRLQPVPRHRMLAMVHFDTLDDALRSVQHINRHGPSAVELLDRRLLELGRDNPKLAQLLSWLQGDPEAVLMVEFDGQDEAEMNGGLAAMKADPRVMDRASSVFEAFEPERQQEILAFRKGGLGIYATVKGRAKPTPGIEDAALPTEHLADYIRDVRELCARHGVDAVFYGHASVGVIHTRPLLDLKSEEGVETFRRISEETFQRVRHYGGSWSGEHGDGRIRAYQNRNLFGDRLYEAFRRVKAAFDPEGTFNPGKVVDAPAPTESLRYGPGYPGVPLETVFDFSEDGGFLGAAEACTGVGACRKTDVGTMCPSYMATRDEDHSTRGRANVLRDALNGRMPGGLTSKDVYDTLDLCLECKACKAECPSKVDMAKLKYEFLQQHHDQHGVPLQTRAMANVGRLAPLGRALAPLANALLPTRPVRWALEKTVGVDRRRVLPRYAPRTFTQRHAARNGAAVSDDEARVALFVDTWSQYHQPHVALAAVRVLEALGYRVEVLAYGCCGRPQISKGLLRDARAMAQRNVARLWPYAEAGIPVVGLEPSCVTAFVDDYRDLAPGDATEHVASAVQMIEGFLAKEWTRGRIDPEAVFERRDTPLLLHGHCQQKATLGTSASRAVLEWASVSVRELDAGCCGMAGSFGYGHHDVSMTIGEQRLFPAVREHDGGTAAPGFSCRHQIEDGTGRGARHTVEWLADALRAEGGRVPHEGRAVGAEGEGAERPVGS